MKAFLIEFKLYFIAAIAVLLLIGIGVLCMHEQHVGAAKVQAKWDLAVAKQNVLAVTASEDARAKEHQQATGFEGATTNYIEVTTHAYPSIAGAIPAALAAGTIKLRDTCPAPDRSGMSETTAASRAADAAATAALAQRVKAAVGVVSVGDASDARERQLSAQVVALQALLRAERGEKTP